MSILDTIKEDLKKSLKDKNTDLAVNLRQIISAINNEAIALLKKDEGLSDEETVKVLRREKKKREDSALSYKEAGRDELAEKELQEAELISQYLPPEMSDEDIAKIVQDVVSKSDDKNFGKIMGQVMQEIGDRADGSRVRKAVEEALG